MINEFCFKVPDKPGELTAIARALGSSGVNIEGLADVSSFGPTAHFHLVVDDEKKAANVLENAGIHFKQKEALLLKLENEPGTLANLSKRLSDEGVNITSFYVTMRGNQVLGTDNLNKAKKIAEDLDAI